MRMELNDIKQKLDALNNKRVVIVRPFFGTQSDSWAGTLVKLDYADKFQFSAFNYSVIFESSDVDLIDDDIIRLKGPYMYVLSLQNSKTKQNDDYTKKAHVTSDSW